MCEMIQKEADLQKLFLAPRRWGPQSNQCQVYSGDLPDVHAVQIQLITDKWQVGVRICADDELSWDDRQCDDQDQARKHAWVVYRAYFLHNELYDLLNLNGPKATTL